MEKCCGIIDPELLCERVHERILSVADGQGFLLTVWNVIVGVGCLSSKAGRNGGFSGELLVFVQFVVEVSERFTFSAAVAQLRRVDRLHVIRTEYLGKQVNTPVDGSQSKG